MASATDKQPTVLQASKDRRLARLGAVITTKAGITAYDYPVPS